MQPKNTIVTKYYALIITILLIFVFIGVLGFQYLIKNIYPEKTSLPPLFIAKMIDLLDKQDKINGIKRFNQLKGKMLGPDLELLNAEGRSIYADNSVSKPIALGDLQKMTHEYDYIQVSQSFPQHYFNFLWPRLVFLVRLAGQPVFYLKIFPSHYAEEKNQSMLFLFFSLVTLIVSLLLGVAVSFFFIYRSIAKHTKVANHVVSELQKGNLKARFPIYRRDEFGRAMLKFNQMAEEMERLFLTAKHTEKVRINLLQELTHDLKTPLSSLKMLLETLEAKDDCLDAHLRKELVSLACKEVNYFAKLIDDLLLLARVSEPQYVIRKEKIDLMNMLTKKIDDAEFRESCINNKKIIKKFSNDHCYIYGDQHLLQRAFRNVLDNAIYFANQSVSVDIAILDDRRLKVIVEDDGCGFSEETKRTFGERLVSRKITEQTGTRVSLNLGSVIIKTVCELHSAKLIIGNVLDHAQQTKGARLEIEMGYCS